MMNGAVDAVRGASSPLEEMGYILSHSNSSGLIVQDINTLERMLPILSHGSNANGTGASSRTAVQHALQDALRFVIVLWGDVSDKCHSSLECPVMSYAQVLSQGHCAVADFRPVSVRPEDVATLVYTSGTTGNPKGVMLTHGNLFYQLANFHHFIDVRPGNATLSLLPPWHIYERACGYFIYACAACQVYSNIRKFRDDLTQYPPDFFVCVPLVLDTLYTKVKATIKKGSAVRRAVAGLFFACSTAYVRAMRVVDGMSLQYARTPRPLPALLLAAATALLLYPLHRLAQVLVFKKIRAALGIRDTIISGGGSLAAHLDDFFEAIGLPVLNGWGLTETSPVLACRQKQKNVRGTVGLPIPGTQIRVVHPDTMAPVPDGSQGLLLVRGPGVMAGYYNDEGATAKAFKAGGGWFDTGDLGWKAPDGIPGSQMGGMVVLTGRVKDTIVLSNGENVEPQPIEDALVCSPYIKHIMLLGQDHRALGALIVPDLEAFEELQHVKGSGHMHEGEVSAVLRSEINKVLIQRPAWEHVAAFTVLQHPFSYEDGTLTRTLKPRRPIIMQKYAKEVAELTAKLR
jgi:long-chain acyl-CoA synthetase